MIHNPIERYQAGVFMYALYKSTEELDLTGSQWVKEFALEQARYTYGEILAKFSGAVPGPLQALVLDQQKRSNAQARLDKLRERLQNMQLFPSVQIDAWIGLAIPAFIALSGACASMLTNSF